ncbi:prenyltransferase [Halobaculum litoreum]|uniref:Prenyltransferase n=1 Tax=Halobaculum litoreum TaxID=3031998 RepID=A0ABD5XV89_9EURY
MRRRALALWRMARPAQVLLILAVYWLGAAMALARGAAADGDALLAGAAVLLPVAASVHYANEYADAGTDARTERTPFSGGSGALADLGLSPRVAARATVGAAVVAGIALAVAVAAGVPATTLALLAAVLVVGWAYSLPPVRLVARGVGEGTNVLLGAVLLPAAGYATLARPGAATALAFVPFAWLVVPNLLATHYADRAADAATGKRTLAVRLSPRRLRALGLAFAAGYPGVVVLVAAAGALPPLVVAAHALALPAVAWAAGSLTRRRSPLPAVAAMATLATTTALAWTWLAHA